MIYVLFKKSEWTDWAYWPCKDKEEEGRVRSALISAGFLIKN